MLMTLELSERRAVRVLEQALRLRAKLEIEPLPDICPELIWGSVEGRTDNLLHVQLHDGLRGTPMSALVGAMCDVRTILSGELYLFSTMIVDTQENAHPRRLVLAVPRAIRFANRRRFARHAPTDAIDVLVRSSESAEPALGELINIGPNGLACVLTQEFSEHLLLGEPVQVAFELPWAGEKFGFVATVCNKNRSCDGENIIVGVEFNANDAAPESHVMLQRLRDLIQRETENLIETDGMS